jgi:hypothetical protein
VPFCEPHQVEALFRLSKSHRGDNYLNSLKSEPPGKITPQPVRTSHYPEPHCGKLLRINPESVAAQITILVMTNKCQIEPESIKRNADWQQGFSLVSFAAADRQTYWATTIPIIDYEVPF